MVPQGVALAEDVERLLDGVRGLAGGRDEAAGGVVEGDVLGLDRRERRERGAAVLDLDGRAAGVPREQRERRVAVPDPLGGASCELLDLARRGACREEPVVAGRERRAAEGEPDAVLEVLCVVPGSTPSGPPSQRRARARRATL